MYNLKNKLKYSVNGITYFFRQRVKLGKSF